MTIKYDASWIMAFDDVKTTRTSRDINYHSIIQCSLAETLDKTNTECLGNKKESKKKRERWTIGKAFDVWKIRDSAAFTTETSTNFILRSERLENIFYGIHANNIWLSIIYIHIYTDVYVCKYPVCIIGNYNNSSQRSLMTTRSESIVLIRKHIANEFLFSEWRQLDNHDLGNYRWTNEIPVGWLILRALLTLLIRDPTISRKSRHYNSTRDSKRDSRKLYAFLLTSCARDDKGALFPQHT